MNKFTDNGNGGSNGWGTQKKEPKMVRDEVQEYLDNEPLPEENVEFIWVCNARRRLKEEEMTDGDRQILIHLIHMLGYDFFTE